MKYFYKTIVLIFLVIVKVAAQTSAATIPDFNFFKADKSAFTQQQLEKAK